MENEVSAVSAVSAVSGLNLVGGCASPELSAVEALARIRTSAEEIRSDLPQRFSTGADPGTSVRQGDIYITLLNNVPEDAVSIKPEAQLAPGSTKGSRHILDSLEGVTMYHPANKTVLQGPIMQLTQERIVTHPQHGHWYLPAGVYGVTYQRQYAEDLRRVND